MYRHEIILIVIQRELFKMLFCGRHFEAVDYIVLKFLQHRTYGKAFFSTALNLEFHGLS